MDEKTIRSILNEYGVHSADVLIRDCLLYTSHIENPKYHIITMAVIIAFVCYAPVSTANNMASSVVPGTDDAMVNSLSWVKDNTPENVVMTSWWDFGHLFATKADRAVTFDGGSQNNARADVYKRQLLNHVKVKKLMKLTLPSIPQDWFQKDWGEIIKNFTN